MPHASMQTDHTKFGPPTHPHQRLAYVPKVSSFTATVNRVTTTYQPFNMANGRITRMIQYIARPVTLYLVIQALSVNVQSQTTPTAPAAPHVASLPDCDRASTILSSGYCPAPGEPATFGQASLVLNPGESIATSSPASASTEPTFGGVSTNDPSSGSLLAHSQLSMHFSIHRARDLIAARDQLPSATTRTKASPTIEPQARPAMMAN